MDTPTTKNHTPLSLSNIHHTYKRYRIRKKRNWLRWSVVAFFSVLIGILTILYYSRADGAAAAWFDEEYQYRRRIPITNTGSAQTDFQVGITVNTASLISVSIIGRKCSARFRESAAFVFGQSAARDEEVHAKRLCSVEAELRRPCQPVF